MADGVHDERRLRRRPERAKVSSDRDGARHWKERIELVEESQGIATGIRRERSLLSKSEAMKNPPPSSQSRDRAAAGLPQSSTIANPAAGAGVGAVTGAAAGAAIGAFAGPPGILAGALIGAAAGAATGAALGADHDKEEVDKLLDEEIGVTAGDLGAADPNAPPAKRGTYSGASAGAGSVADSDSAPDEGPMPKAD